MTSTSTDQTEAIREPRLNGSGKWIVVFLAFIGVIYGYGQLTEKVNANSRDIATIKQDVKKLLERSQP